MKKNLFSLLMLSSALFATTATPWWTGSLLSSNGRVRDIGESTIKPYLSITETVGDYDNHWSLKRAHIPTTSINPYIVIVTGIGHRLQLNFATQGYYNQKGHKKFNLQRSQ